ncbi:type VII secretion-associated serine protease mycosin [Planotetraspora phitsanulokensis]|uniref:Type VII secretion-associated serine protease n=1 Tax=Planotetraspora phitsanulokensis TaxID=575192 RepID=A0A8J3XI98_9ACTN|nr:S8 family serine peptidase [Planotetraspora phitsanulokensis]GII37368.1 type VII secretion-associated serine protease [Planotetraspora phitsanulokensis]
MLRPIALCAAVACALLAAGPFHAARAEAPPGAVEERWALDAINTEEAWKVTKGAGVTVALLGDEKPDAEVAELRGRVTQGPDLSGALFDDSKETSTGDVTAAASLIAGSGSLSGVAPEARILSIRVATGEPDLAPADPQGGTGVAQDSPMARGIRYAANHGATVICIPIAGYGIDRADREAVSYALSRGIVLVAAAGDGGQSAYTRQNGTSYWRFPAGYPGVVGVGSLDRQGRKTASSSDNLSVLVAAPGADVPVVLPGGKHGVASGTGASSALVAGIAALIKAKYPNMAPELVSRALSSTSHPSPNAGYDDNVGFGEVDAGAAVAKAAELGGYAHAAPVQDDLHFGKGPLSEAPMRPGPDPVRLWIYGIAALIGLGGFCGAIVVLSRR